MTIDKIHRTNYPFNQKRNNRKMINMVQFAYFLAIVQFICVIYMFYQANSKLSFIILLINFIGFFIALAFAQGLSAMKRYILFLDDERKIMEMKLYKDKQ